MKKYKLSDLFDIQIGKTPRRDNNFYWGGSNIWVSIRDIDNLEGGKYIGTSKEYISDIGIAESGIKVIPANTLIYSFKLTIGKVAITKTKLYTNEAIAALIPNGKYDIDLDFFFYQLKNLKIDESLFNNAVKGKSLNKTTLSQIEVFCPPIEIQNNIANTLNNIFTIIFKRQRTIELFDEYLKSTFLDMFGDPVTNPHKLPREPLEFFGDWQSGGTPPTSEKKYYTNENINWFTSGELNEVFVDNSRKKISKVAIEESKTKNVKANSLLIGMYDTAALKCSITTIEASCNQAVAFAEIDPQKANPIFVYFNIILSRSYLLNKRRGGRQKNLNLRMIKTILILNPSLEKQEKFVEKFCIVNSLRHNCLMNNELLSELGQYFLFNFKNNLNEFEFFIKDQLKIEQLRDNLLAKSYETTNIYDNEKNLLFEVLEYTEKRNKEAKNDNKKYLDGLVLKFNDEKKIEFKTNRDDKYETN